MPTNPLSKGLCAFYDKKNKYLVALGLGLALGCVLFIHWIALGRAIGPCRATLSKLRAYASLNRVSVQYVFYTGVLRVTVQSGLDLLRNSCYSHLRNGGSMTCVTKTSRETRQKRYDTLTLLFFSTSWLFVFHFLYYK